MPTYSYHCSHCHRNVRGTSEPYTVYDVRDRHSDGALYCPECYESLKQQGIIRVCRYCGCSFLLNASARATEFCLALSPEEYACDDCWDSNPAEMEALSNRRAAERNAQEELLRREADVINQRAEAEATYDAEHPDVPNPDAVDTVFTTSATEAIFGDHGWACLGRMGLCDGDCHTCPNNPHNQRVSDGSPMRGDGCIHGYSYKPDPVFHREPDDTQDGPFFGVELEVDKGDDAVALARDLGKANLPIYMKHDGSLGDEGVEIVTHPATLAYHLNTDMWATIVNICHDHDYLSHDAGTCGLHIHVGRRELGSDLYERAQTADVLTEMTNVLWDDLVRFSRRRQSQIDDWARKPEDVDEESRYVAINLTNGSTVEFRLLRGTLNLRTIRASLQLFANMVCWAKEHTYDDCQDLTFRDVINVNPSNDLLAYCEQRGINLN